MYVGPLTRASELVSMILTPVADAMPGEDECQSSEEMQRAVGDANDKAKDVGEEDDIIIFSQDVRALYPSLDIEDITEAVREAMMETELSFENVDVETVGKYLAVNMSKADRKKSILSPASRRGREKN